MRIERSTQKYVWGKPAQTEEYHRNILFSVFHSMSVPISNVSATSLYNAKQLGRARCAVDAGSSLVPIGLSGKILSHANLYHTVEVLKDPKRSRTKVAILK